MLYEFVSYQMEVDDHLFWVAESKALKGCVGQGDNLADAICELENNEREWISGAVESGIEVPDRTVHAESNCSGKISLRISPFVHQQASELSKELGISLNQFLNDAVVNYSALIQQSMRKKLFQEEYETVKILDFKELSQGKEVDVNPDLEEM